MIRLVLFVIFIQVNFTNFLGLSSSAQAVQNKSVTSDTAMEISNQNGIRLPKSSFAFAEKISPEFVIKTISETGTVEGVEAMQILDVEFEMLVKALTDYNNFTKFMPNVDRSLILKSDNNKIKLVETELDFGLFDVTYVLSMEENIDMEKGTATIEWNRASGDLEIITGRWTVVKKGNKSALKYVSFVDSGVAIPSWIQNMLTKGAVPDLFEAVSKYSKT